MPRTYRLNTYMYTQVIRVPVLLVYYLHSVSNRMFVSAGTALWLLAIVVSLNSMGRAESVEGRQTGYVVLSPL